MVEMPVEKNDKVKIFIHLKYLVWLGVVISLAFMVALILISVLGGISDWVDRLLFAGFVIFIMALVIHTLWQYQTATLSKDGIIIKSPLRKYCSLKWADIAAVSVQMRPTMTNNMGFWWKCNFIIIDTEINTNPNYKYRPTSNRKGRPPYVMVYRPKHAAILWHFLQKYRPDLDASELMKEHSTEEDAKWGKW